MAAYSISRIQVNFFNVLTTAFFVSFIQVYEATFCAYKISSFDRFFI